MDVQFFLTTNTPIKYQAIVRASDHVYQYQQTKLFFFFAKMIFIGAQNKSLQLIVIAAILSYAAGQFVIQAFFDGEGDASLSASVPVPIDQNCTTNKHKHSFKKTCRLGERVNGIRSKRFDCLFGLWV